MEASNAVAASRVATPDRPLARRLVGAVVDDLPLLALMAVPAIGAIVLHESIGFPSRLEMAVPWRSIYAGPLLYFVLAMVALLGYGLVVHGQGISEASSWRCAIRRLAVPERLLVVVIGMTLFPFLGRAFVAFKAMIPTIRPFSWDATFMAWDRWLHFGVHPWEVLQPLLGSSGVTKLIDIGYTMWFVVLWLTFIWQLWHGHRDRRTRSQFLLSFVLCWLLLGLFAAAAFSSVGPVYYDQVVAGPNPYAPLMAYLEATGAEVGLQALDLQDLLWTAYVDPTAPPQGIAAMPSLHVAIAVLMVLVGFRTHRLLGLAYAAFALLIFLGSVHLAWHYAIDGYAGAAGAVAIWWAAGRFSDAWHRVRDTDRATA